ncbi:hypothetical protein FJZ31_06710 [Candidatus Poribacteria bacterium]|nr:hypothetical protein [Candidatus Poribacteria bacterium]
MENISLLPVREFPDSGTNWLLESPENVSGLLQIFAPNLEKRLDFKRLHDDFLNKLRLPIGPKESPSSSTRTKRSGVASETSLTTFSSSATNGCGAC